MITRSSSAKKKKVTTSSAVKIALSEPRVLEDVTTATVPSNTAASVPPKNTAAAEAVLSNTGIVLEQDNDEDYRVVKGRSSILVAVDRHKEEPLKIYWDSKEAKNLFRPMGNENVLEAIEAQIQLLVSAFNGNNWKSLVDPSADLHKEFYLVPGSVADLKEQAMALSVALDVAKQKKPSKTWEKCCEEAVSLIYGEDNLISTPTPPSSAKLQEWYREFREGRYFLSEKKRKENRKEKRDETLRLKKELDAAKKENAVLLAKIEKGLPNVKSNKEAADLLAEIEVEMSKVKIED